MPNTPSWDGKTERRINRDKIDQMHEAIYGNGHPEEGLIWKVNGNTEFINMLKKIFWRMLWLSVSGCLAAIGSLILNVVKLLHGNI